jgi:DNA polymerase
VIRPVDFLLDFLNAEQARGTTHVHLDEGARDALRELFLRAKGQTSHAPAPTPGGKAQPAIDLTPEDPAPKPAPVVATLTITGTTRSEQLESLHRQAANWPPAKSLGSLREIMVFASGSPDAKIMLVTDAPGYHEERALTPFAGPTGEKLDAILVAMGLSRERVYISHLVKFRPVTPKQATNNRQLTPEEFAAFLPILREEVNIIRPSCIIALGESTAQGLLSAASSEPLQGTWQNFHGTPVRVSLNPSCLLRSTPDLSVRRQLWEDMLAVMEKLDMPISPKQRGFFLPKP